MVGLDAAGKTTILYKLKLGEGERTTGSYTSLFDPSRLYTHSSASLDPL